MAWVLLVLSFGQLSQAVWLHDLKLEKLIS